MNLDIKIQWGKELSAKIKKLADEELRTARKKRLRTAAILVQWEAKKEAPVDKGILRKYINYELKREYARVYNNVAYAYWVHEGTKPHTIQPSSKKALFRKTAPHPVKRVQHPWTKANPFFTRAVEKTKSKVKRRYEEILDSVIKQQLW